MPQRTTKTLEELLAIVEDHKKESSIEAKYDFNDDVLNFLLSSNIKSGKESVQSQLIYKIYKNWSKNPLDKHLFTIRLKEYLKQGTLGSFYINKNAYILSSDFYKMLKRQKAKSDVNSSIVFFEFLENKKIKRGDKYFRSYVLYEMFLEWIKSGGYKKIKYRLFLQIGKTALNHKITLKEVNYFGINQNLRETFLTEERELFLKKKYTKPNDKNKSNKKKQNKKPSP